ncbi:MAG: class I SAM-dependent methyltransferase [Chthoniobacteraceae bacterium]
MTAVDSPRPETTSAGMEGEELKWWEQYAEFEQRFAWVQTPAMQRILRGSYIREIVRATPKGGRILELGCGTGWLCRELVRCGAGEVWGVDFSSAQIGLATAQAEAAGLGQRLRFVCADGTRGNPSGEPFDCVVVHAFLHHLDKSELRRTISSIPGLLKPEGVLIVFEPVLSEGSPEPSKRWEERQKWLAELAIRGRKYGLRHEREEEARWRAMIDARCVGKYPHGPSPKEMPFRPGELDEYLLERFEIIGKRRCMCISHVVVQEWLLRGISQPFSTGLLLPFVARIAAWMDRRILNQSDLPAGMWIFTMFICRALPA